MIGVSITFISTLISAFKRHRNLALENLALRQQLAVFKRRHPRPKLQLTDRLFWVWLSKVWTDWQAALIIVKETIGDHAHLPKRCGRTTAGKFDL